MYPAVITLPFAGFAAALLVPRQIPAECTPVTSYVPVLTQIPACNGPACSTNTIISTGQPYAITGLATQTITPGSDTVIGGNPVTNSGGDPTSVIFNTFTQCTGTCTIAGSAYTDVPVFFPTSTQVPGQTTTIVGGQTCTANTPCTITVPSAITGTFVSTSTVSQVTVTVTQTVTQTVGTTTGPTNTAASPTGIPSTSTDGTATLQPTDRSLTQSTTTTTGATSQIASPTAQPTARTCTTSSDCGGLAGVVCVNATNIVGADIGLCLSPSGVVLSPSLSGIATLLPTGILPTSLGLPSGLLPSGLLPTGILTGIIPSPSGLPIGTPVSCTSDNQCSVLGLGVCLQLPPILGVSTGVCSVPQSGNGGASTTASSGGSAGTATSNLGSAPTLALGSPCTSNSQCQAAGLGLCVGLTSLNGLVVAGSCAALPPSSSTTSPGAGNGNTGSGTGSMTPGFSGGSGGSGTGSAAPTGTSSTSVRCRDTQDCLNAGLGLCLGLNVLDSSILGTCAQLAPSSASSGATAAPTAPISIGSPCTSDAQCQAAGLGLCLGLNVNGLITAGTCAQVGLSSSSPVINISGLPTAAPSGSAIGGLPVGGNLNTATGTTGSPSNNPMTTTGTAAGSTSSPIIGTGCRSNQDCLNAGLGVCVGLNVLDTSILGVCVQVLPSSSALIPGVTGTPLKVGDPCTSDAQCQSAGLGLCLGLNVAGLGTGGTCAQLPATTTASSGFVTVTGTPTSNAGSGAGSGTGTGTGSTGTGAPTLGLNQECSDTSQCLVGVCKLTILGSTTKLCLL
ncbi:hypothetical protein PYCC9005_000259 [Savitreella phatthalungensis]